jgi:hypothetical protein
MATAHKFPATKSIFAVLLEQELACNFVLSHTAGKIYDTGVIG